MRPAIRRFPPARRPMSPEPARAGPLKAIQVHDSYLIAETDEGMMVIDQHALHERILYEELRQRVAAGKVESQGLLVPEPVHLSADEAAVVLDHRELLAELGMEIEAIRRRYRAGPRVRRSCWRTWRPTGCSVTWPSTCTPSRFRPRAMHWWPTCCTPLRARRP